MQTKTIFRSTPVKDWESLSRFDGRLLLCGKPYMHKRALATGQKQWPEVHWSIGTPRLSFAEYFPGGPPPQEVTIMVGDLQRCRVYAEKGFQAPVEIPDAVWEAYQRLADAGYDEQVIR